MYIKISGCYIMYELRFVLFLDSNEGFGSLRMERKGGSWCDLRLLVVTIWDWWWFVCVDENCICLVLLKNYGNLFLMFLSFCVDFSVLIWICAEKWWIRVFRNWEGGLWWLMWWVNSATINVVIYSSTKLGFILQVWWGVLLWMDQSTLAWISFGQKENKDQWTFDTWTKIKGTKKKLIIYYIKKMKIL